MALQTKAKPMNREFGAYLMVDWSANSKPKKGQDSIWAAWGEWGPTGRLASIRSENLRTRQDAVERVASLLEGWVDRCRVLVGFDFPYGYPRGFSSALGSDGMQSAWRWTWDYWNSRIQDEDDNGNNRFEAAAEVNHLLSQGEHPFWGHPGNKAIEGLSRKQTTRGPVRGSAAGLEQHRLTEKQMKRNRFPSIQSVWKLAYKGSVGSQVLVGIPRLRQLRFHPDLAAQSVVWPFETGFTLKDTEAQIVHAEIWPSVLRKVYNEDGTCTDEKQVRSLVRHFAELDDQGKLAAEFERPPCLTDEQVQQVIEEEGWILGATTAKPVRSLKKQSRKASR